MGIRDQNSYKQHTWRLKPNETIEITSVYGGPIQVEFDKNGNDVSLKFENVGEHPYWAKFLDG